MTIALLTIDHASRGRNKREILLFGKREQHGISCMHLLRKLKKMITSPVLNLKLPKKVGPSLIDVLK